ncbi:MAG: tRNA lysidine(34) synthetase TilS, partial [Peptococcaceae bacterium]|nr:tRNA lysidine(34) synthetase TilS [Peptococcaceae bacterium]
AGSDGQTAAPAPILSPVPPERQLAPGQTTTWGDGGGRFSASWAPPDGELTGTVLFQAAAGFRTGYGPGDEASAGTGREAGAGPDDGADCEAGDEASAGTGAWRLSERYLCPWAAGTPWPALRGRQPGDWLRLPYGRKKLKAYLNERKIPPALRDILPLLAQGSQVLWIPGLVKAGGPE